MRALVIDDSRTVRMVIGNYLRETGLEVIEAADGQQGLDQLRADPSIELVLVDWNMPVMDGLAFIKAVRTDRRFDPVRIMMVTTEAEQAERPAAEIVAEGFLNGVGIRVDGGVDHEVLVFAARRACILFAGCGQKQCHRQRDAQNP